MNNNNNNMIIYRIMSPWHGVRDPPTWWIATRKAVPKAKRNMFDSFVVFVCWELWKERNRHVFQQSLTQTPMLVEHIKVEAANWAAVGYPLSEIVQMQN